MSYDLRRVAAQAGLRRSRTLRGIAITSTLKRSLFKIALAPVDAWQQEVNDRILPLYGVLVDQLTRDEPADDMAQLIKIAEGLVGDRIVRVDAEIQDWMEEALAWHQERWAASAGAAAGADVFPYLADISGSPRIKSFRQRIASLVRNINDTARSDISETVWRGFSQQTPRKQMAKELAARLGIARRRANTIAVDQAQKLNGEMTRERMNEAGLTHYKWLHSGKVNFRPDHKARDGKIYKIGEPSGDEPGFAIYCGCIAAPVLDAPSEETQQ